MHFDAAHDQDRADDDLFHGGREGEVAFDEQDRAGNDAASEPKSSPPTAAMAAAT
ncbi:MAG: hypothetical protein M3Z29_03655 [Pseudomonadota bacterium]|nr:hypothetical protein [Pseudomonadota bacterium]